MKKSTSQPLALVIILLISSSSLRFPTHGARDTINQTQSIKGGETLVSRSDFYVLRFFEDGFDRSSPKKKYLGISTNSTRRIVWTANGKNPITDGTGVLQLTSDGNLIILQNISDIVWSSNSGNKDIRNPVAKLLDSGNLKITNGSEDGDKIWQSDDYLTNTILSDNNTTQGGNKKKTTQIIIPVTTVSGLIVLLSLFGIIIWMRKKKMKKYTTQGGIDVEISSIFTDNGNWKDEITLFDFSIIASATENFSNHNKIGQGGFGYVYKGTMENGQEIAVKKLFNLSKQGLDEFVNEAVLIAKLQHNNLVRLLGCCMDGVERLLVYEFMQNKSLDVIIFGENKHLLDWKKRVEIIKGIARGLLYLHQDSRLRIIHRDLKAGNVLLDEEMNPKIADFGTARLFGSDQMEDNTMRVIGTYGYMSPEYAMNGIFSMKSDVFSFGILLLEIISGKKNRVLYQLDLDFNLLDLSSGPCKDGNILELLDETLHYSCSITQVLHFIKIGLLCVQDVANDRPSMSDVVFMLSNENSHVPQAKRPRFFVGHMSNEVINENRQVTDTVNELSFTNLEVR